MNRVTCPFAVDKKSLSIKVVRNSILTPSINFTCECEIEVAVYFFAAVNNNFVITSSQDVARPKNVNFPAFAARFPPGNHTLSLGNVGIEISRLNPSTYDNQNGRYYPIVINLAATDRWAAPTRPSPASTTTYVNYNNIFYLFQFAKIFNHNLFIL